VILSPPGYTIVVPDYFEVSGFDPFASRLCGGFYLSGPVLQELEDYGPDPKLWGTFLVRDAIERPTVVLEGLKRENYEHGLCYCSTPARRWVNATDTVTPPPREVFCVYVNPVGAGFYVLDWDWRKVGPGGTGIPYRWQRDFGRIVWPTS